MIGDQEMRAVEDIAEVDEAFVGDDSDPFERDTTTGIIEDDSGMCQAALISPISKDPGGYTEKQWNATLTVGKWRRGLTKYG